MSDSQPGSAAAAARQVPAAAAAAAAASHALAASRPPATVRELDGPMAATRQRPAHVDAPSPTVSMGDGSSQHDDASQGRASSSSADDTRQLCTAQPRAPAPNVFRHAQRALLVTALAAANLTYGLNATMIGNAQIFIAEDFGSPAKLGWVGVGFALGSAVAVLPFSKVVHAFDNKWLCVACLAVYVPGVALCGAAPSMDALIVGRVWAGAAGTAFFIMTTKLFTDFTPALKGSWAAFTTISIFGAGCIVGPVISGELCEGIASWRWIFYLQLIVLGVLAPIFVGCLPSIPKQPDIPFLAKLRSIDWLGTLLLTAVLTSFTIAITSGGTVYAWSSARTIVALVLSAILTIIFCVTQYKLIGTTSLERLFPMSPLWSGQLVSLAVAAALASSALLISIYYIPVHFLFVHADPARGAALRVIPFVSFWWWLLVVCAILLPKTGHHGLWYLLTGLCLTAGGAAMYTVRSWTSPAAIGGYMVLYLLGFLTSEAQGGIGTGIIAASKASDHEKETEAELDEVIQAETEDMTRFFGFAQALGGVVGLTVASAVFQNSAFSGLSKTLRDQNLTRRQVQSAVFGVRSEIWKSQPDAQSKAQFLDTLVKRIDNVWMLVVITGCLYTACAYCLLSLKSFLPKGMLRLRMRF